MGNIYLFIPFGFILSMITGTGIVITSLFGFIFSTMIEFLQYYFCLGMSEVDDVFHNTIGTIIGCFYLRLLVKTKEHYGYHISKAINMSYSLIVCLIQKMIRLIMNQENE